MKFTNRWILAVGCAVWGSLKVIDGGEFVHAQHEVNPGGAVSEPAKQLEVLLQDYAQKRDGYQTALRETKGTTEVRRINEAIRSEQAEFSRRFLTLAESAGQPEIAVSALTWIIANDFKGSAESDRALELLAANHLENEELSNVCLRLIDWAPLPQAERFLRAAAESQNIGVRGNGIYGLALFLQASEDLVHLIQGQQSEQWRQKLEQSLGKAMTDTLHQKDPATLQRESMALLERASVGFESVPAFRGSLSDVAAGALFEAQHLSMGQSAPDIVGSDFDGREFKLSEYRGKVVLLSFWGSWCPQCIEVTPQEVQLVQALTGRPFALLGVNSDASRDIARQAAKDHGISWRNWFDSDAANGLIVRRWNITQWPTFYVIDPEGVIRFKTRGLPEGGLVSGVAPAIDSLLSEIEPAPRGKLRVWLLLAAGLACLGGVAIRVLRSRTPTAVHLDR